MTLQDWLCIGLVAFVFLLPLLAVVTGHDSHGGW